ncbi:hypothetical protein GIB67_040802 [Kingdonia uniflora]|uniref:Embryogenesis-associated protein EMB8 n=1 Tax=Kingdonia uniflora TaxID=39325 RepID=A0A7J7P4E0_9MAGN|nr:hypothetical protein GIB67_040802 [Kingdonia uniflora]
MTNLVLQSPCFPHTNLSFLHKNRVWRRTRLKSRSSPICNSHGNNISYDLIFPALGLVSAVTIYVSNFSSNDKEKKIKPLNIGGQWTLFATPTPFNRFVFLRCPSIYVEDNQLLLLEDGMGKDEELRCGEIRVRDFRSEESNVVVYQRACVSTDDGGVISLDWPANLDLNEEHGMDATILVVPGTTEGSMDKNVMSFVSESLKRGCFPVVMNPRGCAGSPLTTARLFTAADSDDLCTAVQFINRARPWSTLMAVGWGQGANILTKYLAEVAEKTPLMAATCIDNPFDLEEATRSLSHHIYLEQKLTSGLIKILQSNKELFQGRTKRFDVEKALKATSLRDFDKEISVVSYGFETLEEFYSKSSTKESMGKLKIPSDSGTVPPFSIPRSEIAKNPFTSLLLCSCLPPHVITDEISASSWCQHISIEWLMAVEVGLLKGRHPLLKDVDVTINPSKDLIPIEGNLSNEDLNVNRFVHSTQFDALHGYSVHPAKELLEENGMATDVHLMSQRKLSKGLEFQQEKNGNMLEQSSSGNAELIIEAEDTPVSNGESQVLQAAQVVMKMLDVTMPGTLEEGQKKKVLTAMGKGQTLMKALEGAVPEDVRGKLTAAVSGILQTQGTKFNLDGIIGVGQIPNVSSEMKLKIQETLGGLSSAEPELQPTQKLQKSLDQDYQPESSDGGDIPSSGGKDVKELDHSSRKDNLSGESDDPTSGYDDAGSGEEGDPNKHNMTQKTSDPMDVSAGQDTSTKVVDDVVSNTETKLDPTTTAEESLSPVASSPEHPLAEKKEKDTQPSEKETIQPMEDQNKNNLPIPEEQASIPSTINVSQALDALTGFDDSTQVAVNSVFGVLENMISQLEENEEENNQKQDKNENEKPSSASEKNSTAREIEDKSRNKDHKKEFNVVSDFSQSCNNPVNNYHEKFADSHGNSISHSIEDREMTKNLTDFKLLAANSDMVRNVRKFPSNPCGDSLYNGYLCQYLLTKMTNTKSLDLDSTTDLLLDYIPEEGHWKLLDQRENIIDSIGNIGTRQGINEKGHNLNSPERSNGTDNIIETSYVVLDTENERQPVEEYNRVGDSIKFTEDGSTISDESLLLVRNIILESLKVEVGRRLGDPEMKEMEVELARDLKQVADAVSLAVSRGKEVTWPLESKAGVLYGEHIIRTISSAVMNARYLRKVLPVGVTVGSSLAALRKYYNVASQHNDFHQGGSILKLVKDEGQKFHSQVDEKGNSCKLVGKRSQYSDVNSSIKNIGRKPETVNKDTVMAGAVTTALGASALFMHQIKERNESNKTSELSFSFRDDKENNHNEHDKSLDVSEKSQSNIVSSLAEKAMSVAGPVVPTKEGGGIDQERLVAMLADLGQKGGMLKLVGKVALLWGGIRGAISLTERLILFLRLAERPLFQRILGFACMVLVLWSPVVIPLFPTLVQGWASRNSTGIAEYACVAGLYTAVTILIVLWGKRVRGYENSFEQYGLDFTSSPKLLDLFKGFIGGVMVIVSIHSINTLLGCARFSWPSSLPSSSTNAIVWLKAYGKILTLTFRGIMTATVVAIVEELFFRSWLHEEIAVDLGYHRAVILSGLAFATLQCSPRNVPGLWLLSLALSGARERNKGSLSVPVGMRAGIISSSFILQTSGFMIYSSRHPFWLTGSHQLQPFGGAVGLAFCLTLAILLYPRKKHTSLIEE